MSRRGRNFRVALKYCGCCNPLVNLPALARHLAGLAQRWGSFHLVPLSGEDIDLVVILCGCPRACGDKPDVRAAAGQSLLVAGESLGRKPVPAESLPDALEREMVRLLAADNRADTG